MLASFAQARDELGEAFGRIRRQPRAERQEGFAIRWCTGGRRQHAGNERRLARRAPRNETLILFVDERLGAIGCRFQIADLQTQTIVFALGAITRAHELDRAQHREGDGAEERRHQHDLSGVDAIGEERDGVFSVRGGRCGGEQSGTSDASNRYRVPDMPSHAEDPSSLSRYSWVTSTATHRQPARPRESPPCIAGR